MKGGEGGVWSAWRKSRSKGPVVGWGELGEYESTWSIETRTWVKNHGQDQTQEVKGHRARDPNLYAV